MRRLLLVLMIALLPIRGLVGDAMAMAIMTAPAHGATHVEASADTTPCLDHAADSDHSAHSPHAADAHAHAAHTATNDETPGTDVHAHGSCDLCNGPAMGHALPQAQVGAAQHGLAPGAIERFVSVEPLRGIKPPIS